MMQTVNNACASVALLNIVNNVPDIELGDNLQAFKDFTKDFTPALRGDAIANFKFVKDIHNSFARLVLITPLRQLHKYTTVATFDYPLLSKKTILLVMLMVELGRWIS